jgi:TRAP transporter TAXI family solute receptor
MKHKKITILLAGLLSTSSLYAYDITTGSSSGSYIKIGQNLAKLVEGGKVLESKGSIENLERLAAGQADIGIVQLDAYAWFSGKSPEKAAKIEVIGTLYKECIHIAVNKDGKVQNEDDLQKEGATIAIGKQGSGSAVTWDYMMKLEPGYKKSTVVSKGGSRAFAKLLLSDKKGTSGIDAIMWVTRPNLNDKYLKMVMDNPKLTMIEVDDKDLNDTYKPLGRPIYEFQELPTKDGLFSKGKLEVPCVDAAIVARSDADDALLDKVSDVMVSYKSSLLK